MKVTGLLALAAAVASVMATPIIERTPVSTIKERRAKPLPANPDGMPLDPCAEKKKFNHGTWMVPIIGPYYELNCDYTIDATLTAQAGSFTNEKCMKLCSNTDGCQGVVMTSENACSLSTGGAGDLAKAHGVSAWVATSIAERSVDSARDTPTRLSAHGSAIHERRAAWILASIVPPPVPSSKRGVPKAMDEKRTLPVDDYDWACQYVGVQPPISVVEDAYESFCNKFDGHTVAADGTWTNNTWTIKGNLVYLAVHAAGPNGKAFVLSYNNCIWGFEAVRDSCSINGGTFGSGYAFYYNQVIPKTYLIGSVGDTLDPCDGSC